MYVVQDHGPGSNSAAILKVEDGNASFVCSINSGHGHGGAPAVWGNAAELVRDENPSVGIARILCIELERRDAMK